MLPEAKALALVDDVPQRVGLVVCVVLEQEDAERDCVSHLLMLGEVVPLGGMEGLPVVETVEVCETVVHSVGLLLRVAEWLGDTDRESVSDLLWEGLMELHPEALELPEAVAILMLTVGERVVVLEELGQADEERDTVGDEEAEAPTEAPPLVLGDAESLERGDIDPSMNMLPLGEAVATLDGEVSSVGPCNSRLPPVALESMEQNHKISSNCGIYIRKDIKLVGKRWGA